VARSETGHSKVIPRKIEKIPEDGYNGAGFFITHRDETADIRTMQNIDLHIEEPAS